MLLIIFLIYTSLPKDDIQQASLLYIVVPHLIKMLNRLTSWKALYYIW